MFSKRKTTDAEKNVILGMATSKSVADISRTLGIDGRIVSGIISAERNRPPVLLPPPSISRAPFPFTTKEDQLKALAKSWKDSEPDAEFSMHTEKGQKVYVACYKGGIVLRVGEQKKVALLTSDMASRLGGKLIEMAQWSVRIR